MKDLNVLVRSCCSELNSLGIGYGAVRSWTINTRAQKRWGQCKKVENNLYDISISESLLQDSVDDNATKSTIIHELLHTATWGEGHRGKWKQYADKVNRAFPQYNIKRSTTCTEKGLEPISESTNQPALKKYAVICTHCGHIFYRERATSIIKYPNRYQCRCGGNLKLLRN